jgi:hypothetical protein
MLNGGGDFAFKPNTDVRHELHMDPRQFCC